MTSIIGTPPNPTTTTMIHIMALDSMVNANSLFTFALFIGMVNVPVNPSDPPSSYTLINPSSSCTTTSTHTHNNRTARATGMAATAAENLVTFHVFSFASFLFSSLVALTLKQAIKISSSSPSPSSSSSHHQSGTATTSTTTAGFMFVAVNKRLLLTGILASSAASVSGCVFLVLALVDLVQIKLGSVFSSCRGYNNNNLYSVAAIVPLLVLVPFSLLAYISILLHAFVK